MECRLLHMSWLCVGFGGRCVRVCETTCLLWGQQKKGFSGKGDEWIEEGIWCLQPWGKD